MKKILTNLILFMACLASAFGQHTVPSTQGNNTWTGQNLFQIGQFAFNVGQSCPTSPSQEYMTGINADFTPQCQTVSGGGSGVSSYNTRTGAIVNAGSSSVVITEGPTGTFTFTSPGSGVTTVNGANGPITLAGGTGGVSIVEAPSGTFTINISGSAGTGTVVAGGPRNLTGYGNSGSVATVQPTPNLASIDNTMNVTQINSLVASFNCGSCLGTLGTVIIPDNTPYLPFFNQTAGFPAANPGTGVADFRTGTHYQQMTTYGIVPDARLLTATFTNTSTNVSCGGCFSSADVGKTFSAGYQQGGYNGTQWRFMPTISAYVDANDVTISTPSPFSATLTLYEGTDNTAAFTRAMVGLNENLIGLLPGLGTCCAMLTDTIPWNNSQQVLGMSGASSIIVGTPAHDVWQLPDVSGQHPLGPGDVFGNHQVQVDNSIDPTRPYTNVDASGNVTFPTPLYRPVDNNLNNANNPLGPAYCISHTGPGGGLTTCPNYVANITQNSAVVCVPTALGRMPSVGWEVMFRDTTSIFTSTVVSLTGAGCAGGFSPFTMAAAFPNTSGYTLTQTEFVASTQSTGIQNLGVAMTAGAITYPLIITVSNPITPVPGLDSNAAGHGVLKIGNEIYQYIGINYTSPYEFELWNGPSSTVGWATGTPIAPMNPCYAQRNTPWPVVPTLNSGDSTPSGARTFPGLCVGNAGVSMPQANGNVYVGNGPYRAYMNNMIVQETYSDNRNTAAGLYIAGNNQPYATTLDNWRTNAPFGLASGEASYGQHGVAGVGPTGDGVRYTNWSITAAYPMSILGAQDCMIDRVDAYSTAVNPFNGTAIGAAESLYMNYSTDEQNGNGVQSSGACLIADWNAEPENGSHIVVPPYSDTFCYQCQFINDLMEGAGQNIYGTNSIIDGGQWGAGQNNPVILGGSNIKFADTTDSQVAKISNVWGVGTILNWGANNYGSNGSAGGSQANIAGTPGQREPASGYDNGSFRDGLAGTTPYVSDKMGYFSPTEFGPDPTFDPEPFQVGYTIDPSAPISGAYVACYVGIGYGCTPFHLSTFGVYIGQDQRVVAGAYNNWTAIKTTSNQTLEYQVNAVDPGGAGDTCPGSAVLLNQSINTVGGVWTTYKYPVDFTGHTGCLLQFVFQFATSADVAEVAYEAFQPVPKDTFMATVSSSILGNACTAPSVKGTDGTFLYICNGTAIVKVAMSATLVPTVLCHGTMTFTTGTIAAAGNQLQTQSCPGLVGGVGGDNIIADFVSSPLSTTGYKPGAMLTLVKYPDPGGNQIDIQVVNNTGSSLTTTVGVQVNYIGIGLR